MRWIHDALWIAAWWMVAAVMFTCAWAAFCELMRQDEREQMPRRCRQQTRQSSCVRVIERAPYDWERIG